jgi:hypothetical protein
MVTGKSAEATRYYPEKVNRPGGAVLTGETQNQDHMANWIDCIRSRKSPNAPVEIAVTDRQWRRTWRTLPIGRSSV